MIASVLFIGVSVALFVYWFRYTCLMILNTRPAQDFARATAEAHGLNLLDVQATLSTNLTPDLDALQQRLDADYAIVMRVMGECNATAGALEAVMLKAHYFVMRQSYSVCRRLAPAKARFVLCQMADTVSHFAAVMGEQAAGA